MTRNLRSIHIYKDIEEVLDQVIASGADAFMEFPNRSDAIVWRHRANKFRVALRVNDEIRNNLAEGEGTCIYDGLWFKSDDLKVHIKTRRIEGKLVLFGEVQKLDFDNFDLEQEMKP